MNEAALRPGRQREVVDYLVPEERDRLMELGVALCLPLMAMNRLVALVLLGEVERLEPEVPRREAVRLGGVLVEAVGLVEAMARRSRVEIRSRLAEEQDVVQGDRDQLIQVFVNLLLNGIQAMPEGGVLSVELKRGRRLRVVIGDTGWVY